MRIQLAAVSGGIAVDNIGPRPFAFEISGSALAFDFILTLAVAGLSMNASSGSRNRSVRRISLTAAPMVASRRLYIV